MAYPEEFYKGFRTRPYQRKPVSFTIKKSCTLSQTKIDMFEDVSTDSDRRESGASDDCSSINSFGSFRKCTSESFNYSERSIRPKMSHNSLKVSNGLLKLPSVCQPKNIFRSKDSLVLQEQRVEISCTVENTGIEDLQTRIRAYEKRFEESKYPSRNVHQHTSPNHSTSEKGLMSIQSIIHLGYQMPQEDVKPFSISQLNRNITVCEIRSPSHFFIQFCKNAVMLNNLAKAMESEYKDADLEKLKLRKGDLKEGLYVVCRYSDQWRRAQITKKLGDTHASVLHIDYGCQPIMSHEVLFLMLDKPFLKVAPMAFAATLHGIKHLGPVGWDDAATSRFKSLVTIGEEDLLVAKYKGGGSRFDQTYRLALSIFPKKGDIIRVGDKLIEEMLAEAAP